MNLDYASLIEVINSVRHDLWGDMPPESDTHLNAFLQSDNPIDIWAAKQQAEDAGLYSLAQQLSERFYEIVPRRSCEGS